MSQYADDIAIWQPIKIRNKTNYSEKKINTLSKIFQHSINAIQEFMFINGFDLSAEKINSFFFPQRPIANWFKITLDNNGEIYSIPFQSTIKFLGVTFS